MGRIQKVKDGRGGAGRGQGRKQKYGEPTIKVNYRIPESKKRFVDQWMAARLAEWLKEFQNKK